MGVSILGVRGYDLEDLEGERTVYKQARLEVSISNSSNYRSMEQRVMAFLVSRPMTLEFLLTSISEADSDSRG